MVICKSVENTHSLNWINNLSSAKLLGISDDSISGFQFWYDINTIFCKISRYRYHYFQNDKYVNPIQAEKQDVNVQQGNMLYVGPQNMSVNLINSRLSQVSLNYDIVLLVCFG